MKIALVHDDLIQFGGAEKMVLAMHEMYPEAPLYTSFASSDWVKKCNELNIHLRTSFMQRLPFKKELYKFYFLLYPLAFESFNLSNYDVVISSSARFAHGVITKPTTYHICYKYAPGRAFWEPQKYFQNLPWLIKILTPVLSYLRIWDFVAAQRVNKFLAVSTKTKEVVKKIYRRDSEVLYPFVETNNAVSSDIKLPTDYFLIVSRLSPWKRVDVAIEACLKTGRNLIIVGEGSARGGLEQKTDNTQQILFLGHVNDNDLAAAYTNCKAVIITQEEDFGIVAVEAAAYKKPVLAFKAGGSLEIVKENVTGEFFWPQNAAALSDTIRNFDDHLYQDDRSYEVVTKQFSKHIFMTSLKAIVDRLGA
ncbi:MAG: glycosyltransferase [candidate division WWE3 bacterium]|nr:glycosyltransferase [candidate division WWE3 bacterium]